MDLRHNMVARFLLAAVLLAVLIVGLLVAGVLTPNWQRKIDLSQYSLSGPAFDVVSFRDLPGWRRDSVGEVIDPFLLSCVALNKRAPDEPFNPAEALGTAFDDTAPLLGYVSDWNDICDEANALTLDNYVDTSAFAAAVRTFFQNHFVPIRISNRYVHNQRPDGQPMMSADGTFTGYFEPVYQASLNRSDEFTAAVYTRPDDLVMVDLGAFRDNLAGQRIAGRLVDGRLHPYPDHAEINRGALGGHVAVIAYMRPDDLFFLQIQGSGRLELLDDGGRELFVGYDGQNGHRYHAIGRSLVERGEMTVENASMQRIRTWLTNASPEEAAALREENRSYVFFKVNDTRPSPDLGPYGAGGVQLTARRSLAVDRRYIGLGGLVYVAIKHPLIGKNSGGSLMVAQDIGGAIKGPVRGDVYFGSGSRAGDAAGGFNETGGLYVLVPKPAARRFLAGQDA